MASGYRVYLVSLAAALVLFAPHAGNAQVPNSGVSQPISSPAPQEGEVDEEAYAKDATTEINVKNADIAAIVRIFSKKTKRNYILDERVKGKVSIYLPGRVSAEESIRILDAVLNYKGFSAVPIGENLWKILPSKEARGSTIPTLTDDLPGGPSPSMVTRFVQLKFVAAEEVKQLVSQLISADGLLSAYTGTNSLIIIDSEDNVQRLVHLIGLMDVPSSDRDMTIIPVVYADATDIADKLNEILGTGSKGEGAGAEGLDLIRARMRDAAMASTGTARLGAGGNVNQPGQGGGLQTAANAGGPVVAALARQPKIIPDQRTNAVIVIADEDTTARVRALVSQLDSKMDLSGNRFYVYHCQHATAEDLADVLSGLTGGGGFSGGGSSMRGEQGGLDLISGSRGGYGGGSFGGGGMGSSGFGRSGSQNSRTQQRLQSQRRTPGQSRRPGRTGGVSGAQLGEEISITADPATNSLIIFASKADYEKLKALLEKLDIKRRQVLVEAMLLEVGLDNNQTTSTSFITSTGGKDGGMIAQNNGADIMNILKDPASVQNFSVAAASAGTLSIGDAIKIPTQTILLNAVRSNSNVNILSAPTILTTDNEEAEIVVGQNVPFVTSTATNSTDLNNTFNSVDRQDVGITLRLTPQISSSDTLALQIFTEVSTVVSTDPKLGPTTAIRTTQTSVVSKDGQMIVIGGLMSDDRNASESGVPYLKDIPVLGHLFRSTVDRHQRTNLLILLTPRIIRDQFDARDATLEGRDMVEKEIERYDIHPDREEVLRSQKIDHVSESNSYDGPLPSTILGPDHKTGRVSDGNGVLEFKVNPRLPEIPDENLIEPGTESSETSILREGKVPSPPEDNADPEAALSRTKEVQPSQPSSTEARWVVLKVGSEKLPGDLPFSVTPQGSLVGLLLPAESGASTRDFFRVGQVYSYRMQGGTLSVSPVGVFNSQEQAAQFYPEVNQAWYTLSPYEIMNLGDGPWVRGGR